MWKRNTRFDFNFVVDDINAFYNAVKNGDIDIVNETGEKSISYILDINIRNCLGKSKNELIFLYFAKKLIELRYGFRFYGDNIEEDKTLESQYMKLNICELENKTLQLCLKETRECVKMLDENYEEMVAALYSLLCQLNLIQRDRYDYLHNLSKRNDERRLIFKDRNYAINDINDCIEELDEYKGILAKHK